MVKGEVSIKLIITSRNEHFEIEKPADVVLFWNSYQEEGNFLSLPKIVEERREELREKVLDWVFQTGQSFTENSQFKSSNQMKNALKAWQFSPIAVKDPWICPEFGLAVKMLALEGLLLRLRPNEVVVNLTNLKVCASVSQLVQALEIDLSNIDTDRFMPLGRGVFRRVVNLSKVTFGAVRSVAGFTRFVANRWHLRKHRVMGGPVGRKELVLCNYFINFQFNSSEKGSSRFTSNYWGQIPELFAERGWNINWLHIYILNKNSASQNKNKTLVQRLNQNSENRETHRFLESTLSLKLFFKTISRAVGVWISLSRSLGLEKSFPALGNFIDSKLLFKDVYLRGLFSAEFLVNILRESLFDKFFQQVPDQQLLLYLFENQPWEQSLVRSWRAHHSSLAVGVFHDAPKFWNLRLYSHQKSNKNWDSQLEWSPNLLAVNSPRMIKTLQNFGISEHRLVEIEAARYLKFQDSYVSRHIKRQGGNPRVMIVPDGRAKVTEQMIFLIKQLHRSVLEKLDWSIKFHPNYIISREKLNFPVFCEVIEMPLDEVLSGVDIVLVSGDTSACIDAVLSGCRVIVVRNSADLNFSPMLGDLNTSFVDSPQSLENALISRSTKDGDHLDSPYFFIDQRLSRWKKLETKVSETI
ncbi:TIGR04326 family surface carbohydrate biosynthesis protein [Arenicellales bacterium IMCC58067]